MLAMTTARAARVAALMISCLALWLAAGVAVAQDADAPAGPARPNILFIFSDDHAAHAISAYGSRLNRTPNIDRIANEGMRFDRCCVTNSICAPSRAVILTGKHSHLNGVYANSERFDGSQMTFPKLLQAAGYQTAMIGKWHLKTDPTGFDHWYILPGQGLYYNPAFRTAAGRVKRTGYVTDIITDETLGWLERRDKTRPFLLMCQHKAPHRNWQPSPDHLNDFNDVTIPESPTLFDDWKGLATPARVQRMTVADHMLLTDLKLKAPWNLNPEQLKIWNAAYEEKNRRFREAKLTGAALTRWHYQRYMKDYLRCIASVDDSVGKVLDYLEKNGLADNTVVIYSSDQGFFLGDHGWYDKRWAYEESLKMPLVVRWPGRVKPGSTDGHLVQNLDFAPTLLEVAGVKPPAEMQGRSLAPLLAGQAPADWRDAAYYHYYEEGMHGVTEHYGVITPRYKLLHHFHYGEWELLDREKDPHELESVAGDPAYAAVEKKLKARLAELAAHYGEKHPATGYRDWAQERLRKKAAAVETKLVFHAATPEAELPKKMNPSAKPLTVSARVTPAGPNGVVAAHGGDVRGWSLYLKDGRPHFAVRFSRFLREVAGPDLLPPGAPTMLAGRIAADGTLHLYVNGEEAAKGPGYLIRFRPREKLMIGGDGKKTVGNYEAPNAFAGTIEDVRLWWGWPGTDVLVEGRK